MARTTPRPARKPRARTPSARAQGWIFGAINPLLQALEIERVRLSVDLADPDAGNVGFRWEQPKLKYVGHLRDYLSWDRREILHDWLRVDGARFEPAGNAHDVGIDRLFTSCRVAHGALRDHPRIRALLLPIEAANPAKVATQDAYFIAAERVINNTTFMSAITEGVREWTAIAEAVFAAASQVEEYQKLLAVRGDSIRLCDLAQSSLRALRTGLADKFGVEVAFSG